MVSEIVYWHSGINPTPFPFKLYNNLNPFFGGLAAKYYEINQCWDFNFEHGLY